MVTFSTVSQKLFPRLLKIFSEPVFFFPRTKPAHEFSCWAAKRRRILSLSFAIQHPPSPHLAQFLLLNPFLPPESPSANAFQEKKHKKRLNSWTGSPFCSSVNLSTLLALPSFLSGRHFDANWDFWEGDTVHLFLSPGNRSCRIPHQFWMGKGGFGWTKYERVDLDSDGFPSYETHHTLGFTAWGNGWDGGVTHTWGGLVVDWERGGNAKNRYVGGRKDILSIRCRKCAKNRQTNVQKEQHFSDLYQIGI